MIWNLSQNLSIDGFCHVKENRKLLYIFFKYLFLLLLWKSNLIIISPSSLFILNLPPTGNNDIFRILIQQQQWKSYKMLICILIVTFSALKAFTILTYIHAYIAHYRIFYRQCIIHKHEILRQYREAACTNTRTLWHFGRLPVNINTA